MQNLAWIAVALVWIAGVAGAVYLSINHHPVFAVAVLICCLSVGYKSGGE